jgi:hypothetical protein
VAALSHTAVVKCLGYVVKWKGRPGKETADVDQRPTCLDESRQDAANAINLGVASSTATRISNQADICPGCAAPRRRCISLRDHLVSMIARSSGRLTEYDQ